MIVNHFKLLGEDGTVYWAIENRAVNRVCSLGDDGFVVGLPEYRLDDGRALKQRDDCLFTITRTGETLSKPPEKGKVRDPNKTERNLCKRPWGQLPQN